MRDLTVHESWLSYSAMMLPRFSKDNREEVEKVLQAAFYAGAFSAVAIPQSRAKTWKECEEGLADALGLKSFRMRFANGAKVSDSKEWD